jgi:hypothetical protein
LPAERGERPTWFEKQVYRHAPVPSNQFFFLCNVEFLIRYPKESAVSIES